MNPTRNRFRELQHELPCLWREKSRERSILRRLRRQPEWVLSRSRRHPDLLWIHPFRGICRPLPGLLHRSFGATRWRLTALRLRTDAAKRYKRVDRTTALVGALFAAGGLAGVVEKPPAPPKRAWQAQDSGVLSLSTFNRRGLRLCASRSFLS